MIPRSFPAAGHKTLSLVIAELKNMVERILWSLRRFFIINVEPV
jgi:hypothetical protein